MKFKELKDAHLFLLELGKTNLIETVKENDWIPSKDLVELFIKGRRAIIPKLKDFRKSQTTKASWRKNRNSMMAGIKSFHKSTKGKQFHRSLGRYLATRIAKSGRFTEHYEEKYEALKGLSSLRTHIYIENGYYKTLEEQIDFESFMDEIIPVTLTEEFNTYKEEGKASEEDLDILCRSILPEDLLKEYCIATEKEYSEDLLNLFNERLTEEKSFVEVLQSL